MSLNRKDVLLYLDILAEQLKDPYGVSCVSPQVIAAFVERVQPFVKELLDAEH